MAIAAGEISHWFAQLYGERAEVPARPPLSGSREADVCVVGAGYTGLWTAYALKRAEPSLDVVVLEANTAGFGASGRNGGAVIGTSTARTPAAQARPATGCGRCTTPSW